MTWRKTSGRLCRVSHTVLVRDDQFVARLIQVLRHFLRRQKLQVMLEAVKSAGPRNTANAMANPIRWQTQPGGKPNWQTEDPLTAPATARETLLVAADLDACEHEPTNVTQP